MTILVLCTGNSCRSQITHGFLKTMLPGHTILSAGTETHGLNPKAVATMAEIDIDISDHESTLVDTYLNDKIDILITVCDDANEACPAFPGQMTRIHHSFKDPSRQSGTEDEIKAAFRKTREEIRHFCEAFVSEHVK